MFNVLSKSSFNYIPCFSPLHIAARQGLTPVVQDLIAKGASLTATDNKGQVSGYTVLNYHTFISLTVPV